jgi:hypothetical protein
MRRRLCPPACRYPGHASRLRARITRPGARVARVPESTPPLELLLELLLLDVMPGQDLLLELLLADLLLLDLQLLPVLLLICVKWRH